MSGLRIVVVENDPMAPVGRLGAHLEDVSIIKVSLSEGGRLPPPDEFDAAVVLGGRMGAYETDEHPWLATEVGWLSDMFESNKPTLGICLGAQLLAVASGGMAFPADSPEVGIVKLFKTEAAADDRVFASAGSIALAIHSDTFELSSSAVLLAESERFPHAFRVGEALGLQFHPETNAETAVGWLTNPHNQIRHGLSPQELSATTAEVREVDRVRASNSDRLFSCWLETIPVDGT